MGRGEGGGGEIMKPDISARVCCMIPVVHMLVGITSFHAVLSTKPTNPSNPTNPTTGVIGVRQGSKGNGKVRDGRLGWPTTQVEAESGWGPAFDNVAGYFDEG